MKSGAGWVLSHDPGVGVADFFDGIGGYSDKVGIPLLRGGVVVRHAIAQLDEGVLDVARLLLVVQVFGELLVGEMAAEPCIPPEQEWHEHDEPSGGEEKYLLGARHAALGLGRGRCGL